MKRNICRLRALIFITSFVVFHASAFARDFSIEAVAQQRLTIDRSACRDFDEFVNGKWYAHNPIGPSQETSDSFSETASRVRTQLRSAILASTVSDAEETGVHRVVDDFWRSGSNKSKMEHAELSALTEQLRSVQAIHTRASLRDRLADPDLQRFLFTLYASPDFYDPDKTIAYISPGRLGLPDRSYYFDPARKTLRERYVEYISKVLSLTAHGKADFDRRAEAILRLEEKLAFSLHTAEQLARDQSLSYNLVPLLSVSRDSSIKWFDTFSTLGVSPPGSVSEVNPAFHRAVRSAIDEVSVDVWKDYLSYRIVADASEFLAGPFGRAYFAFWGREISGRAAPVSHDDAVMTAMDKYIGEALGQIYVESAFAASSKDKAISIANDVLASLNERITRLSWMSDETKAQAKMKAKKISLKIGFPDHWTDWSGLKTSPEDFIVNMHAARIFSLTNDLDRIGHPTDRSLWYRSPHAISAYYRAKGNEIVIPAARLQSPFFFPTADSPINYGAIGAIIGHELSHAFDDQGSRFDGTGKKRNWWTAKDREKFEELNAKLMEQFGRMETYAGKKINGTLTLGENSADLVGIQAALGAMHTSAQGTPDPMIDGLTMDQRFFVAYAISRRGIYSSKVMDYVLSSDPHSPPKQRINGPLKNLPEFQAAFKCVSGDDMYLSKAEQIEIW